MGKTFLRKRTEFKNRFSWSKSRDELFRECLRKYYYDKYAFWGGWDFDADRDLREIYILKQLESRWMWKGDVVHCIIKDVIQNSCRGYDYPPKYYMTQLHSRMRNDYKMSKVKRYHEDPKKITGLFEHEYNLPVKDEEWKAIYDGAVACLENFFKSGYYSLCKELKKKGILEVEQAKQFNFGGVPVWVKLDLAYKKDGKVFIVDWKTGKTRDIDLPIQFGCYTLYAIDQWKCKLEDVKCIEFNLAEVREIVHNIDEQKLQRVREYMQSSISSMKGTLKDEENNEAKKDDFPLTDDLRACRMCNFKRLCGR